MKYEQKFRWLAYSKLIHAHPARNALQLPSSCWLVSPPEQTETTEETAADNDDEPAC